MTAARSISREAIRQGHAHSYTPWKMRLALHKRLHLTLMCGTEPNFTIHSNIPHAWRVVEHLHALSPLPTPSHPSPTQSQIRNLYIKKTLTPKTLCILKERCAPAETSTTSHCSSSLSPFFTDSRDSVTPSLDALASRTCCKRHEALSRDHRFDYRILACPSLTSL